MDNARLTTNGSPQAYGTRPRGQVHLGLADPARVVGADKQVRVPFRSFRDDMAASVLPLLTECGRGE